MVVGLQMLSSSACLASVLKLICRFIINVHYAGSLKDDDLALQVQFETARLLRTSIELASFLLPRFWNQDLLLAGRARSAALQGNECTSINVLPRVQADISGHIHDSVSLEGKPQSNSHFCYRLKSVA